MQAAGARTERSGALAVHDQVLERELSASLPNEADMKMIFSIFGAFAAALLTGVAFAADSGDRTSMPERCLERDVNCVIPDGPPRRRGSPEANIVAPATKGSSATGSSGISVIGSDRTKDSGSRDAPSGSQR